jgi:hypothetical protein
VCLVRRTWESISDQALVGGRRGRVETEENKLGRKWKESAVIRTDCQNDKVEWKRKGCKGVLNPTSDFICQNIIQFRIVGVCKLR